MELSFFLKVINGRLVPETTDASDTISSGYCLQQAALLEILDSTFSKMISKMVVTHLDQLNGSCQTASKL